MNAAYFTVLMIASVYGLHRYWLVVRYYRTRDRRPSPSGPVAELPTVTVQLPLYNEWNVVERIIDAACRLDYPADRLQIQVLDDSTDDCALLARRRVERWQTCGVDIVYLHRSDRTGYKAGALQAGLEHATGELIAIFDADFIPPRDYLHRVIHHFADPGIGMVQAAWSHLNRNDSLLTRCQAIYLDGHFQIEHAARNRDGHWFNFNGTGGIWRREAIESSGGWQHETLTEDMDLSYRAQLAGWRFIYRQDVDCPAELPVETAAFKTQQHRWTKGTVETALKLLPRILRSGAPRRCKLEAAFHLTSPVVYPCVIVIALFMLPAMLVNLKPFESGSVPAGLYGLLILLLATASGVTFYIAGQIERGVGVWRTAAMMPAVVALGVGMTVNNTVGVIEALFRRRSAFVRTPKYNQSSPGRTAAEDERSLRTNPPHVPGMSRAMWTTALELLLGVYLAGCLIWALASGPAMLWTAPFLLIFASGYLYVGVTSVSRSKRHFRSRPIRAKPLPALRGSGISLDHQHAPDHGRQSLLTDQVSETTEFVSS